MKRLVVLAIALALAAGVTLAQKTAAEKKLPRFDPAQVVASADAVYPIHSIAFGTVVLQVTVNTAGDAEDVRVVRGIPSLTEEALRSIKKWKFTPAKLDGRPVRSTVQVAFVFSRPLLQP